jgi:type II secretory pathway pseudopilin PulG
MTRRRRSAAFTLSEILVALALAGLVSVSILTLARGQLRAHEMNDQILRAQANVRAAVDYTESVMRRACGGMTSGALGLNVGNGVPQKLTSCISFYDGAATSGGTFATGSGASAADAIELIYPITAPTVLVADATLTTSPSLTVADGSSFKANDLVLVTDNSGGDLFRLQTPNGNVLTMYPLSNAASSWTPSGVSLTAGASVFRVASVALFSGQLVAGNHPELAQSLLLDPDGMAGTTHDDADPLVDGVDDFQIAIGIDGQGGNAIDGTISENPSSPGTDEWIGNYLGETLPAAPWNSSGLPLVRLIRATILVRTLNTYTGSAAKFPTYSGTPPTLASEDRTTYPSAGAAAPRYRPERISVAPRAWTLAN